MTLTTVSVQPSADGTFAVPGDCFKESCRDYNLPCPGCWESAMGGVLAARYRRDDAETFIRSCSVQADKLNASEYRPGWADVLPFVLSHLDQFYQHGSRAVPTMTALLTKMAHAANAAGK